MSVPDAATEIAEAVKQSLWARKGLGWDDLGPELRAEIMGDIARVIATHPRVKQLRQAASDAEQALSGKLDRQVVLRRIRLWLPPWEEKP